MIVGNSLAINSSNAKMIDIKGNESARSSMKIVIALTKILEVGSLKMKNQIWQDIN